MIAMGRLGERKSDRVSFKRTHTNKKWRQIESAKARVCLCMCVVRGMQNADNMTDFGRKFWIYYCFALKSDMLLGWALILLFNFRENALYDTTTTLIPV